MEIKEFGGKRPFVVVQLAAAAESFPMTMK